MIRAATVYWLTCICGAESPERRSMVEATQAARDAGWVIKDGVHRCPVHGGES